MYSIGYLVRDLLNSSATSKPEPREEIYASDLGKAFIDRYLKMKGVPYSNPIDGESLSNFILGKSAEEAFISLLNICSIPNASQNKIIVKKSGCLPVTGRSDLLVGVPDWGKMLEHIDKDIEKEKSKAAEGSDKAYIFDADTGSRYIQELEKKDYSQRYEEKKQNLIKLVKKWQDQYPDGLPDQVAEIKTISLAAMKHVKAKHQTLTEAYPQYAMQLYTYMLGLGLDQGTLIFIVKGIGKNFGWFEEVVVHKNEHWDKMFWEDVEGFSKYFLANKRPPLEPITDKDGKLNWKATWSDYKDLLYKDAIEKFEKDKENAKRITK